MRSFMATFAILSIVAIGGCKSDKHHDDNMNSSNPKMMSDDACPHCPGKQTATADGKCPVCGANLQTHRM